MTREEAIEKKRLAYQLDMLKAMGWNEDEVTFKD
jgi:hypothetical protein